MKPLLLLLALGMTTVSTSFADTPGDQPTAPQPSPTDGIDRTQPPKAGPLPPVVLPEVITKNLDNGLRLFILRDQRQPTVTFRMLIKAGALYDGDSPGLASMTASLLNKGTSALNAEAFAQKTDFLGAQVEASAGDDSISVVASGLSRDAHELIGYFSGAILDPAFSPEELEKERRTTISDLIAEKANPGAQAALLRNQLLYGSGHPYGAHATPETVSALTREQIVAFHRKIFIPNNATLVIVGDIDPDTIGREMADAFQSWKKGEVKPPQLPEFPEIKGISFHLVERPASVQSELMVAGVGVARNNPDLPELQVVNSVLGGGFSGRLFSNLREKHGYTYGSYSGFGSRKLGGAFSAMAQVRNEVTAAATREIFHELERLRDEPIPEEELKLQRTYLAGNYLMSLESDRRIAERVQEIDLYGLPEDYWQEYANRLTTVTPEVASRLAKKYIDPKDLVVVVVGKAEEVLPQLQALGPVTVYDADLKAVSSSKGKAQP
ncbi:MAG TPA: pitrilysin family protein [Chthoniobacteraceae bacterium]|nr:pitrilysin family protein [Chthoniobacteraceae bacterium]